MSEELSIDDIDDDIEEEGNKAQAEELRSILLAKCKESGIETEIVEGPELGKYVVAYMPNGREKRRVVFSKSNEIQKAINLEFEKYVFLGNFEAIANYEKNTIEAGVRFLNNTSSVHFRKIFRAIESGEAMQPIAINDGQGKIKIEIGKPTDISNLLSRRSYISSRKLSIKISGILISNYNKTLQLLRQLTDSLFFQLDVQSEVALSLLRERRPTRRLGRRSIQSDIDLEFPRVEFDEGPISLYWYARSALGMPLLQFLAFYQVIEYYFPAYSQEEARKRVREILKDPVFRYDQDSDIGRVLSILSGSGRGFGGEKSQLRATINACLDPADLREFFYEDTERKEFFATKQKGLTDQKIPLASKEADLRVPVSDLIYDIRCKIVHTKRENAEGEVELLLPFSKEAKLLLHDIELMQYVARKVLISASAPMSL